MFQKFYRYHEILNEKENEKNRAAGINVDARPPYWKIFKQSSPQLFNVFFVFFITLSVFPSIHSDIKPSGTESFPIDANSFVGVVCFLTFNLTAMLGSLATSWVVWVSFI